MRHKIIPYNPKLKELAKKLRKNMTLGEVLLWNQLKQGQIHGYDFDRQRPIDRFIVDFYCKELMLALEIDGASHNSPEAQAKDKLRQEKLELLGVMILRFTETEVRNDMGSVLGAIEECVLEKKRKVTPP